MNEISCPIFLWNSPIPWVQWLPVCPNPLVKAKPVRIVIVRASILEEGLSQGTFLCQHLFPLEVPLRPRPRTGLPHGSI